MVRSAIPVSVRLFTSSPADQQAFAQAYYALKHGSPIRTDKVAVAKEKIRLGAYSEHEFDIAIDRFLSQHGL